MRFAAGVLVGATALAAAAVLVLLRKLDMDLAGVRL